MQQGTGSLGWLCLKIEIDIGIDRLGCLFGVILWFRVFICLRFCLFGVCFEFCFLVVLFLVVWIGLGFFASTALLLSPWFTK